MAATAFSKDFYNTSVGLLYFSYQKTVPFTSHRHILTRINGALDKQKTNVHNLLLWGDFDFMSLIYTKSTQELINLSRITPGIGPGIKDFTIKLGTVIYNEPSFTNNLESHTLPIKAVVSIKCNKSFIKFSRDNAKLHKNVNSFFSDFINLCISIKNSVLSKQSVARGDISLQIIAPYSWEDFIIILNSNYLELINAFLVSIRQSTFATPKCGLRHLLFSSNSLIGFPLFAPSYYQKAIAKFTSNIIDNNIQWSVKLRIRPGHATWVLTTFLNGNNTIYNYDVNNLIGTYDVIIRSNKPVSFISFLKWFFTELSPILKSKGPAILSAKTDFLLNFEKGDSVETSTIPNMNYHFLEESLRLKRNALNLVPEHILSAFVSIASTFEYLVSQHTTISREFKTISDAFILFLKTFEDEILKDIVELQKREEYPAIIQNIAEIIEEFSYIFGERFKGGHPVGKTLSEIPTVTYSGSFQKILQGIEVVINDILHESGYFIQKYSYNKYIGYCKVCCRIRNIDSPCNRRQFNNAFIHFPLDTVLFQENWYYILHEIGHVLLEELLILLWHNNPGQRKLINKSRSDIQVYLKELFADAFSMTILFNGDVDLYMRFLKSYCEKIMKWNIPDITFELRKACLNIFSQLKENGKLRVYSKQIEAILTLSPSDKAYILRRIRLLGKLVNGTDILTWLHALKKLRIHGEFTDKLVLVTKYAHNYYYGNRKNKGGTHTQLRNLRREMIHDFWFRSNQEI